MLRQIIAPALLAIILLSVVLGFTFSFVAQRMDAESIVYESRLLAAELAPKQQNLEQNARFNAEWDEAYTKTFQSFDKTWFDVAVGDMVETITHIDAVLLIQTGGQLLYSRYSSSDKALNPNLYGQLVRNLQRDLSIRPDAVQTLRGYLSFNGEVYLIGASTIWPQSEPLIEQATGDRQRNILVVLEKLDPPKLSMIENKLELNTLTVTSDIGPDVVHLAVGDGAYLTWEPKTPGTDFLANLALPSILFAAAILLILVLFWRRTNRLDTPSCGCRFAPPNRFKENGFSLRQ